MKKKFLYLLMAAMFAIALPSCGNDDEPDEPIAEEDLTLSVVNLESGSGQYTQHPDLYHTYLLEFKSGVLRVTRYEFPDGYSEDSYSYYAEDGMIKVKTSSTTTTGFGASLQRKDSDGSSAIYLVVPMSVSNIVPSGDYLKIGSES